jgi:hypothetical protein
MLVFDVTSEFSLQLCSTCDIPPRFSNSNTSEGFGDRVSDSLVGTFVVFPVAAPDNVLAQQLPPTRAIMPCTTTTEKQTNDGAEYTTNSA